MTSEKARGVAGAAAVAGNSKILIRLLDLRPRLRLHSESSGEDCENLLLILAAEKGHLKVVEAILNRSDSDSGVRECEAFPALLIAAEKFHSAVVNVIKKSLRARMSEAPITKIGFTALMRASIYGRADIVKSLLKDSDVSINLRDTGGRTALHMACLSGEVEVAKMLLEDDHTDVNVEMKSSGLRPLMIAAGLGHQAILEHILGTYIYVVCRSKYKLCWYSDRDETNINARDKAGDSASFIAQKHGQLECLQVLLRSSWLDVNMKNRAGRTIMQEAIAANNPTVVYLVLRHPDLDLEIADSEHNRTALHFGAISCLQLELLEDILIRSEVNARDSKGRTPLILASEFGCVKAVHRFLIREGIDVNAADDSGRTALMHASRKAPPEIVKLLLLAPNINLGAKDNCSRTALHEAASRDSNRSHVAELLLNSSKITDDMYVLAMQSELF